MAYKVIILYQLYMPSYFLGTFTEYPFLVQKIKLFCRYFRKCYTIVTRKFETKTWINSGFLLF